MFRGLFRESTDSISSTEIYESQLSDTLELPTGSLYRGHQGDDTMEQIDVIPEKPTDFTIPIQESGGKSKKGGDKKSAP